ncbi:MAG: DUF1572 family protein [Balneolaceae bacterium]
MDSKSTAPDGSVRLFKYYKLLVEKSITQLKDEELHQTPSNELNSVAILMKHLSGNMISRWTNFRTEDGEKSWRNRDNEFINDIKTRKELLNYWEKGWNVLFESLHSIENNELNQLIYIRNEGHTILEAVERHLAHVAYHTGQIVMLAKWIRGESWETLTIPKGKTEEFNQEKFSQPKSHGFYKNRL